MRDVPGKQSGDAVDRVVGDVRQDVAQVDERIEAIHLRRADQTVHGRGTFTAGVRAAMQPILTVAALLATCGNLNQLFYVQPSIRDG